MHTQVCIIGAGPAGLLLSHLLHLQGIESVVLEKRSREHVEGRVRAGMLEWATAELLKQVGLGERMRREGMVHDGFTLVIDGHPHRIDLADLTGGRNVTIYGQAEVVKDMIQARLAAGGALLFEAEPTAIEHLDGERPVITFTHRGETTTLHCDHVAGCDGFHGISRQCLPAGIAQSYSHSYPLAWLGILAEAPVYTGELVYSPHQNGFSLFSMRTPQLSRAYLQCAPGADLADWPDDRIWHELHTRLEASDGKVLSEGPIVQKSVTVMRSFLVTPMQHGRLYLAGDAAHIVPPSAAKGLNAAVADVVLLSRALHAHYQRGDREPLTRYSTDCLKNAWQQQQFSWRMTRLMHRLDHLTPFEQQMQRAELAALVGNRSAAVEFAESYVGLPWAGAVLSGAAPSH